MKDDHPNPLFLLWQSHRKQVGGLPWTAPGKLRIYRQCMNMQRIHYNVLVEQAEYQEGDALDALQLKRYCCRRMLLGHVVRSLEIIITKRKPEPMIRLSFSGPD